MKRMVLVVALMVLLAPAAWADYENGVTAFSNGDYETALTELKPLAEKGNVDAQFFLGVMFGTGGQGIRQDYAESAMWLRNAAKQGHIKAEACLGLMYGEGKGVKQDYAEAERWYRKAAEQGNANAQSSLADLYREGKGLPQDNVQAHLWYNLAATGGAEEAAKLRDEVALKMTPQQISRAQELARNWKPRANTGE